MVAALLVVSQILFLPRLARWIDSRAEPKFAEAAALEAQYREMTNAFVIAAEMPPDHPAVRVWRERRQALLAVGFLETQIIEMKQKLTARNWSRDFFFRFHALWPGVERTLKTGEGMPPVVEVTARWDDFAAITRFIQNYQPEK